MPPLLIRVDADSTIGSGHFFRCLALAQSWRRGGGEAVFLSRPLSERLAARLRGAGFEFDPVEKPFPDPSDAEAALRRLDALEGRGGGKPWLVVDGYHFGPEYLESIRAAGRRVLVLDDTAHLPRYPADLILNQNLGAEEIPYPCDPECVVLAGSKFVLLREEFLGAPAVKKVPETARRVLVTLGGADPDDLTGAVLAAAARTGIADMELTALVGPDNPRLESLKAGFEGSSTPVRWVRDSSDMRSLIREADVVVSAAGSTSWELASQGIPALLIEAAPNQSRSAARLDRAGAAANLGPGSALRAGNLTRALDELCRDRKRRENMAALGPSLIDGRGADRVVSILNSLDSKEVDGLSTRPTGPGDAVAIWRLANDPGVRRHSYQKDPFPFDHHMNWFRKVLADPEIDMRVLELHGLMLAQIRYNRVDPDTAEIDFSVIPAFRGRSLGTRILDETWRDACRNLGVKTVRGIVIDGNPASVRAFEKSGFTPAPPVEREGYPCGVFEKSLPGEAANPFL